MGVLYDEPFGAAAEYTGDSNFVSKGDLNASIQQLTNGRFNGATIGDEIVRLTDAANNTALPDNIRADAKAGATSLSTAVAIARAEAGNAGENTNVEVRSQSLTGILGMKFGANKNFQIYAGPVAQRIQSETKLRGLAYGPATGYTSNSNPDMDYGYICLLYTSPSPRDRQKSRMPSSA